MRVLSTISNVDAPTTDYPGGRIRNKNNAVVPPVVGSPVVEEMYGDIIQFFQRLLVLGGVTPNDLPDNVTNGYQAILALLNSVNLQLKASDAEAIAGTITTKFVTPANLAARDNGIYKFMLPIGDWNMDSTASIDVFLPLDSITTFKKIIGYKVIIFHDDGTLSYPLDFCTVGSGGEHPDGSVNAKVVGGQYYLELTRRGGGSFDSVNFNSTSYNRGYAVIEYIL